MSGGFPHSDISGSKPIPGSPKLNAGYHVLHRLLLPRHPPNALFALDLIQKEQDHWFKSAHPFQDQKLRTSHRAAIVITTPVSVLDLETVSFLFSRTDVPTLGRIKRYRCFSLYTMSISSMSLLRVTWTFIPCRMIKHNLCAS